MTYSVTVKAESIGVDMRGADKSGGRVVLMMTRQQRAEAVLEMLGQMTDAASRELLGGLFPELLEDKR